MSDNATNDNNLVIRDEVSGDVLQDNGTSMTERESYERVVDGLKIAAEACSHLVASEPENTPYWRTLRLSFDHLRKAAMTISGLSLVMKFEHTQDVRGLAMDWRTARERLRYGLKQSEGGMRQLAGAHRGDLVYSRMANELAAMQQKIDRKTAKRATAAARRGLLWVPEGIA